MGTSSNSIFTLDVVFGFQKGKIEDLQPLLYYVLLFLNQATLVYISMH